MKPSIATNVPKDQVRLKVPHEFQAVVDPRVLKAGPYTVIAFPGSSSIVDSRAMSRALAKIGDASGSVVVVAHNFTAEARSILERRGALRFNTNDFFWTDAALANVRSK